MTWKSWFESNGVETQGARRGSWYAFKAGNCRIAVEKNVGGWVNDERHKELLSLSGRGPILALLGSSPNRDKWIFYGSDDEINPILDISPSAK